MTRIDHNELTIANAAKSIQISERQMYRLLARYRANGDAGIIHRVEENPLRAAQRQNSTAGGSPVRERYRGLWTNTVAEKLDEYHQITLSAENHHRIQAERL